MIAAGTPNCSSRKGLGYGTIGPAMRSGDVLRRPFLMRDDVAHHEMRPDLVNRSPLPSPSAHRAGQREREPFAVLHRGLHPVKYVDVVKTEHEFPSESWVHRRISPWQCQ